MTEVEDESRSAVVALLRNFPDSVGILRLVEIHAEW